MSSIYRFWGGPDMPDDYREYGRKWAELNPGREVQDWSEADVQGRSWANQAVIDHLYERDDGRHTIEFYVTLADVVSYELLLESGGSYFNCDVEPLRPLSELEDEWGLTWVAREDELWVVNSEMGGEPGHPFYADLVGTLGPRYFADPYNEMVITTGPKLLTLVWARHAEVSALPVEAFNAVHWTKVPHGSTAVGIAVPESAYGRHHWGHRRDGRTNIISPPI